MIGTLETWNRLLELAREAGIPTFAELKQWVLAARHEELGDFLVA